MGIKVPGGCRRHLSRTHIAGRTWQTTSVLGEFGSAPMLRVLRTNKACSCSMHIEHALRQYTQACATQLRRVSVEPDQSVAEGYQ